MAYTPVNPYVVLAEVIEELKMKPADVASNAALTDELNKAIDRASRWVDEYTQRDYFFHDFTVTPLVFDQFTEGVYGREIFFPFKPILSITKLIMGPADRSADTLLDPAQDYFNDASRLYMLQTSRQFILNVDIPRDGASALSGYDPGWNLHRPERCLFFYGKAGFIQPNIFPMTQAGDTSAQTSGWKISSYGAPATLYWQIKQQTGTTTVSVFADAAFTQLLASASTTATGAQTVALLEQNGSGIVGTVSFNYTADDLDAGNTLAVTPNAAAPVDTSRVPQGLPGKITTATRLVAAAFSGHNRKEWVGLDGTKQSVVSTEIPKTVKELLGRKMPILV